MSIMIHQLLQKGSKATALEKKLYCRAALYLCGVGHNGATVELISNSLQAYDTSELPHVHFANNGWAWQEIKGGRVLRQGWITKKFRVTEIKVAQSGRVLEQTVLPFGNRGHSHPFESAYRAFRWGAYTAIG